MTDWAVLIVTIWKLLEWNREHDMTCIREMAIELGIWSTHHEDAYRRPGDAGY